MSGRLWLTSLTLHVACTTRVPAPVAPPQRDPSDGWASLLERAASPEGVDYDLIARERAALDHYLAWIGEHGPHLDEMRESQEDRRMAFLINAYNASVVSGVLAHQPLESVRDLRFGIWQAPGSAFFVGLHFRVDGEWLSLRTLEVQNIVARFQEPLVHAALNCASKGCPPLRWYTSTNLQGQMAATMRAYVNSDMGLRKTDTGWAASAIFDWYRDDFLDWSDAPTVCAWLEPYASGQRAGWLNANRTNCRLEVLPYDWSLNQATAPLDAVGQGGPAALPGPTRSMRLKKADPEAADVAGEAGVGARVATEAGKASKATEENADSGN